MLQQVSVYIENRPGRMVEVLKEIADHGLNINGMSVTDSADFGLLRLILSDSGRGYEALVEAGYIVRIAEVLAIEVSDEAGSLTEVLSWIGGYGINIHYLYAFGTKLDGHAMIILKTDDDHRCAKILQMKGISELSEADMQKRLNV